MILDELKHSYLQHNKDETCCPKSSWQLASNVKSIPIRSYIDFFLHAAYTSLYSKSVFRSKDVQLVKHVVATSFLTIIYFVL